MERRQPIKTDSTRFLMPLTYLKRKVLETKHFINAYMWSTTFQNPNNNTLLLVYSKPNKKLNKKGYTYETINNTIIYSLPIEQSAFKKILKGKYSMLSENEKQTILNFWNIHKHSRLSNILHPTDYMAEISISKPILKAKGEIWPRPNTLKETLILPSL